MNDINELRRLAEVATPGPWEAEFEKFGSCVAEKGVSIAHTYGTAAITGIPLPHEHNAAYIAACSPDVILALLSELGERDVGIKPLEWVSAPNGMRWSAPSILGEYRIYTYARSGTVELSCGPVVIQAECPSAEDAKTIAQSHLTSEIRSALVPSSERDALRDRVAELEGALESLCTVMEHCSVTDGMCCCGEDMERHSNPMDCGHSPVDHGSYAAEQAYQAARALLSQGDQQ